MGWVPAERCVQLGYFCLQLPAMQANPGEVVPSREADLADIRPFRQFNRLRLASDTDGLSTWNNLLADLRELILLARPEVIVLPHPHFDPHPDHVRAQERPLGVFGVRALFLPSPAASLAVGGGSGLGRNAVRRTWSFCAVLKGDVW